MNASGSPRPVVMAMFLAASAWLMAPQGTGAHEQRLSAADTEVLVYGREQAIVDEMTKKTHAPDNRKYPNELDHVLSSLLARAYPRPQANKLARHTVDALCQKLDEISHKKIPDWQRNAWVTTATRTQSFESVLKEMEAIVAGGVKREPLVSTGLAAMLGATGSKSAGVLNAPEAERITNMLEARAEPGKEHGTLGLDVSGWPRIRVVPLMPAARAGLRDGDIVLRVGARDVARTESAADGLKALGGIAGTVVSLTVKRGSETLTVEVHRASPAEKVTASVIAPGIVYVRIPTFEGSGIAQRVRELIHKNLAGASSAVILDLRDNTGGRPEEANGVADLFLDEKCLQIYEFSDGRRVAFKSKPGALDVPVILLTNRDTACAAETVVMALHDNRRATVIGQRTAGVLAGHDGEKLRDGRIVFFRSEPTILSPTGNDYAETGLSPDILVNGSKGSGEDRIIELALQLVRTRTGKGTSQKPMP